MIAHECAPDNQRRSERTREIKEASVSVSVRRVCEKKASMENGKDRSHDTQDPALNGECYLHASTRTGTIVRAATSQKRRDSGQISEHLDKREKNSFGAFRTV